MMDFTTPGHKPVQPNTSRFKQPDVRPAIKSAPKQPVKIDDDPSKAEQPEPTLINDTPAKEPKSPKNTNWVTWILMVFLLCILVLVVSMLLFLGFNEHNNESSYVNSNAYQAVEVNTGDKVAYYYGNISAISSNYLVLNSALAIAPSSSLSNLTLKPIRCVAPNSASQLVFNRQNVVAWNNLNSDSKVSKAISDELQSGDSCSTSQTQASSEANKQPASSKHSSDNGQSSKPSQSNRTSPSKKSTESKSGNDSQSSNNTSDSTASKVKTNTPATDETKSTKP